MKKEAGTNGHELKQLCMGQIFPLEKPTSDLKTFQPTDSDPTHLDYLR